MGASALSPKLPDRAAISPPLLNACLALFVVNAAFFMVMSVSDQWIVDPQGLGIPTDFINVWSAGWLVLQGQPATAYDWDIQKQAEIAILGRDYVGNFAWHYPPPFLFVAALRAHFPYVVAFIGWTTASLVPYLLVMRAIVGRPFGLLLAVAFPVILANTLVGQNGFLTAALIGGTLYLLPARPILAGICLGLLSYKPAIRRVVSAGNDRRGILDGVQECRDRDHRDRGDVVARFRLRQLARVLSLDADVLIGRTERNSAIHTHIYITTRQRCCLDNSKMTRQLR